MALLHIQILADYVGYLEQTPNEAHALMHDLLVGLTQFFRDANTFASLESRIIPQLLETKVPGAALRVWVAGCSSGEEAYSIAMLLHAAMHSLHKTCAVQIFATDINCGALAVGRRGHYAPDIARQLSADRLTTYFTAELDGSGYRIRPFIRDMLIFSEHDVNQDPPFTHIDLLSCRNVMIYMGEDAQTRLIRRFHFALRPQAALVLGTSEDIGENKALFSEWERDTKIYQRKQNQPDAMPDTGPTAMPGPQSPAGFGQDGSPRCGGRGEAALHALWNHALVQRLAPHNALVTIDGDIRYLCGDMEKILDPAPTAIQPLNILRMARHGMGPSLHMALLEACRCGRTVRRTHLFVHGCGHLVPIHLAVLPLKQASAHQRPLFLVVLEALDQEAPSASQPQAEPSCACERRWSESDADPHTLASLLKALEWEVRSRRAVQQGAQDVLQIAYVQMKSTAEELQSLRAELQSAYEELKTSKEHLLTLNRELLLSNRRMQQQMTDLKHLHDDVDYLLAGSGNGSIYVDHHQHILRFTPAICAFMPLVEADIGRPIADLVCHLRSCSRLEQDIQQVLDTLVCQEMKVQSEAGRRYCLKLQPYRNQDNLVDGVVITLLECMDFQPGSLEHPTAI